MIELLLIRDTFTENTTLGKLFANGTYFCHTLEDTVRAEGIKVHGHTAIPAGVYRVKLSWSSRFNRIMPMVFTEDNEYELFKAGIRFNGIRMHGGNTHRNTEGCILVANNRLSDEVIQGTAEEELVALLEQFGDVEFKLTVKNR